MDEVEEETYKEVVEGAAAHMKMEIDISEVIRYFEDSEWVTL